MFSLCWYGGIKCNMCVWYLTNATTKLIMFNGVCIHGYACICKTQNMETNCLTRAPTILLVRLMKTNRTLKCESLHVFWSSHLCLCIIKTLHRSLEQCPWYLKYKRFLSALQVNPWTHSRDMWIYRILQ